MIKLIVLDVDGCMSDGKLWYSAQNVETKNFNVKDGLGIVTWLKIGNEAAIITGRTSDIVAKRAEELGIRYFFQGIKNKAEVLKNLTDKLGITMDEVAAIGDDLNDYNMLKSVGVSFTPKNGVDAIKEIADVVLSYDGGDGAVREMIDMLVKQNNQEKQFMDVWIK